MLTPDRHEAITDVSFFMNEVAERGVLVVAGATAGSGAAMDDAAALATVAANGSGRMPLGVLLNDVVNLDLTRQHINFYKDEVQQGGKVTILRAGWCTTNKIQGNPVVGNTAYLGPSGLFSASQGAGYAAVGQFLSVKNGEGFAKVSVNLS